jgi:DNA-binding IclR family transcriptional regulator
MAGSVAGTDSATNERAGDTPVSRTDGLLYGLEILALYKPGVTALSTDEIAERVGLPRRRVRQLVGTLANSRFIVPVGKTGRYRPAAVLHSLNRSLRNTPLQHELSRENSLQAAAAPILERLASAAGATVVLAIRNGIWMDWVNYWLPVHSPVEVSAFDSSRIYESPLGLAWIAAETRENRRELMNQIEAEAQQDALAGIYRAIGDLMSIGYCRADDRGGRLTFAAPLMNEGTVVASISCSRPLGDGQDTSRLGDQLLEAVARVAAVL